MPIVTERAKNFLSETIDFMQTWMNKVDII